jgi:hypothetical protein
VAALVAVNHSGTVRPRHEHDLADHTSFLEQLLRVPSVGKRKPLRDDRLDLVLAKEVEKRNQILLEQRRFEPLERLDAVGDHPLPAWEKATSGDVQGEDGGSTKALTMTGTT